MENKLARFLRIAGRVAFFIPLGAILLVLGIVMLSTKPAKYGETIGSVTNVTEYTEYDSENGNETKYDVEFSYTVDGKTYTNTFSGYSEAPAIGSEVKVYYDPANPQSVSNTKNTGIISVVMIIAGAAILGYAILSCLKSIQKNKEMDEQIKNAGPVAEVIPPARETLTEYYVSFDGKSLKPGYIVEDGNRNTVYSMAMTKNSLVGNRIFTFTDHKMGHAQDHEVGHTISTTYNDGYFSTSSWFKFDGKNIWDHLHEKGIRITTDLHSKFPKMIYTVSLNGGFLATVETAGRFVHEEDAQAHKVNIPVGKYFYRVWTNAQDLELLLLTVFAISETEQAVVE